MRIITDSGSMMSQEQAKALNVTLIPLQVEVAGKNYRDYFDLSAQQFVEMIKTSVPNSSQPAIGEVMAEYEKPEEALHIAMTKGLSSTYNSALGILNSMNVKHITLFNSKTLAGTQKYLVELAARLSSHHSVKEITDRMETCLSSCQSYLIPVDFDFLKRGGRLSSTAAILSGFLHLKPIVTQTEGSEKLEKFGVARTWRAAADDIVAHMIKQGVDLKHKVFISHALNLDIANLMADRIKAKFAQIEIEILALTPVMITQGGPGCVAVQFILRDDND
jgi:DegV family protein with EDD domain